MDGVHWQQTDNLHNFFDVKLRVLLVISKNQVDNVHWTFKCEHFDPRLNHLNRDFFVNTFDWVLILLKIVIIYLFWSKLRREHLGYRSLDGKKCLIELMIPNWLTCWINKHLFIRLISYRNFFMSVDPSGKIPLE